MRTSPSLVRALAVALLLLPASASQAGKLTVQFDFGASSVSVLGGFIDVPPDGSINAASGEIDFGATGLSAAGKGAAALRDLSLAGTFAKSGFGVNVSGAIGATQPGTATGNLFTGNTLAAFNPFVVNFTGFALCTGGTGCTILGLPANFTGPKTVSIPSLAVANLNSIGNASVNGTFTFTLGGFTAVLSLVGNEVGRTFVPEPHTAGLFALGLAGLGIARRARR